MAKSMLKRTQITAGIAGIRLDHKKWNSRSRSGISPCIFPGHGAHYNCTGTFLNLPLLSALKPALFDPHKINQRGLLWVHVIRATRSPDDGGDGGKNHNSLFSVFSGIIWCLIRLSRGVFGVLYRGKGTFEKIEEKVEKAVEIVEEVADTVKEVAEVSEEIAEKIEKHSKEGEIVHDTAEIVDEISETVEKDAEMVEKQVEKIKKAIKTIEEKVGKAEEDVNDIAEKISEGKDGKEMGKTEDSAIPEVESEKEDDIAEKISEGKDGKEMGKTEDSAIPKVESEKEDESMDSKYNCEGVGFEELLRRLTWMLFWATKLSPKILGIIFVVSFLGEELIGTSVNCYFKFMISLMS